MEELQEQLSTARESLVANEVIIAAAAASKGSLELTLAEAETEQAALQRQVTGLSEQLDWLQKQHRDNGGGVLAAASSDVFGASDNRSNSGDNAAGITLTQATIITELHFLRAKVAVAERGAQRAERERDDAKATVERLLEGIDGCRAASVSTLSRSLPATRVKGTAHDSTAVIIGRKPLNLGSEVQISTATLSEQRVRALAARLCLSESTLRLVQEAVAVTAASGDRS